MKRVITMQDISCAGKCSLTVALPVLSAMGIETVVLPTAVLSTHTMFSEFTFHDMTDQIQPILRHLKQQDFTFEAIYTGYLGSFDQVDIGKILFQEFGQEALKIVDPCMGDNGKLYTGFNEDFAHKMRELCSKADIICPNLTEAAYLLDIPYPNKYNEEDIQVILKKLSALGCKISILTGISFSQGKLGAYAYDSKEDKFFYYYNEEEPKHFHGTGDIWTSTFTGALLNQKSLEEALEIACDYVKESIHLTLKEKNHNEYGVNFEQAMPYLIKKI